MRLIDADALVNTIVFHTDMAIDVKEAVDDAIEDMPTIERLKGRWILLDECSNSGYYCSECHKKVVKEGWSKTVKKINYCPNCGADMKGGDSE